MTPAICPAGSLEPGDEERGLSCRCRPLSALRREGLKLPAVREAPRSVNGAVNGHSLRQIETRKPCQSSVVGLSWAASWALVEALLETIRVEACEQLLKRNMQAEASRTVAGIAPNGESSFLILDRVLLRVLLDSRRILWTGFCFCNSSATFALAFPLRSCADDSARHGRPGRSTASLCDCTRCTRLAGCRPPEMVHRPP